MSADRTTQAKELLAELFEPQASPPSTFYKILLLGIRDAYDNHRDLLEGGESVNGAERFSEYYQEALRFWKIHDRERAIYYLGGALYHLQDAWLGLAENPSYEAYLEKTLQFEKRPASSVIITQQGANPETWIQDALQERNKVINVIEEKLSKPDRQLDEVTLELARRAEVAGAGLLLKFFMEALSLP